MAPLAGARQQEHRILSELQATFAHSTPGPVTSTPDGATFFVAEAGVLAVVDTSAGQTGTGGFENPVKIEPISSQGVRAVELLLDPEADLENDPTERDALLYVAGGRLGLWAMKADPGASQSMPATRIDNGEYPSTGANTWCNSLEVIHIDGTAYLAALFAHEGCSRLRLYELEGVRDLLDDSTSPSYSETGNELTADADVGVGGNCTLATPRYGSFGYGMTVDDNVIYVALGRYGLVKVAFATNLMATVTEGPYFGTGSYYANTYGAGYDDFEFRQVDPDDATDFVVTRQDPPQFIDVVVQDDESDHLLWAAVDNLGLVVFDLDSTWSTTMSIIHQEGVWVASSGQTDTQIRLVDDPDTSAEQTFAHRLAIVPVDDGEEQSLVLAAGVNNRPIILSDSILDEGRTLGHLGVGYQGTGWPSGDIDDDLQMTLHELMDADESSYTGSNAQPVYTVLYDLGELVHQTPGYATKTVQHDKFLRQGGRHLFLPDDPDLGELLIVGGHAQAKPPTPPSRSFLARYDWPFQGDPEDQPTGNDFLVRELEDRPGWHSYDISHSPRAASRELIYMGSTDGGCAAAGIMADCGSSFVSFLDTTLEQDGRGTFGILFDPQAVWEAPAETVGQDDQDRDFVFGAGRPLDETDERLKPHWMLVHMDPGEDVCDDTLTTHREPERLKEVYFGSPEDEFQRKGRGFYNACGGDDPDFDDHCETQTGGSKLAFVGRSATPAGVFVLDRDELEDRLLTDTTIADGDIIERTDISDAFHRELMTHPEFQNAYDEADPTQGSSDPLNGFLLDHGLNGPVLTLYPELLEFPAPSEATDDMHWVLAVPSAAVYLPDLDVFTSQPTWAPDDIYTEGEAFDHAMIRVFDVHDYSTVTDEAETLDVYTLLGPREQCAAVRLKTLTWEIDSEDRHFLFVTNFTDSVMAWEITDLLDRSDTIVDEDDGDYDDYFLGEWITPASISDAEDNNAWHIDVVNEVWTDSQQVDRDEVYVYAAVGRYGIAVLRFLPDASQGQRLVQVDHLRTPNGMGGLKIREDGNEERTLLLSETHIGLRTYTYPE